MINLNKLKTFLEGYTESFSNRWNNEKYKWEAVKNFQDNWDIEAPNFGDMFTTATDKTFKLLSTGYSYPRGMIINFSKADDEGTRLMFRNLFDESHDLGERVRGFQAAAEDMRLKYDDGMWRKHYQNTNIISTYLWLMYPDTYYIYKYEILAYLVNELDADYTIKRDGSVESMLDGFGMYDEICQVIQQNSALVTLLHNTITDNCYQDPAMKTATVDIGMYLYSIIHEGKEEEEWFPKDYTPKLTVEDWVKLLNDKSVFTRGSLQIVKRMKDYGGQATCKQLSIKYGGDTNYYNSGSSSLARRIAQKTGCPTSTRETGNSRWWPILYTGKYADSSVEGSYIWKLRSELSQAIDLVDLSDVPLDSNFPETSGYWMLTVNPNTGSFSEIEVGDEQTYPLHNKNGNKRQIFQNVPNVKIGDSIIGYEASTVRKITALGRITQENDGMKICFEKTESLPVPIAIDYSALKNYPSLAKMESFVQPDGSFFKLTTDQYNCIMNIIRESNPVKQPDTELCPYTKEMFLSSVFMTEERYNVLKSLLRTKMNVILQGAPGVGKTFTAKKLAYAMMEVEDDSRIEVVQFHQNYSYEDFIMGYHPDGADFKLTEGIFYRFCQTAANNPDLDYFFIIDEINRGNLSKILGELLMLIEKEYRGTKATLAYNGKPFSVPKNLYIIGMMNTADRSLAMIDYALRRRFSFFEIEPGFTSEGFQKYQSAFSNKTFNEFINQIRNLNKEITADKSLGRGFRIGHSYFCGRNAGECTTEWMRSVLEFDILPMLSEYWFDEPEKLQRWENNLRNVFEDE